MIRMCALAMRCLVVFLVVSGGWTHAGDFGGPEPPSAVEIFDVDSGEDPVWGPDDASMLRIHASEFRPQGSATTTNSFWDSGITYVASDLSMLHAPVILPTGALIVGIGFDAYDVDASFNINFGLRWVTTAEADTSGSYGYYVNPTSAGYYSVYADRSPGDLVESDRYLFALVDMNNTGQDIRVKGMRVYYKLQISPAPGVATFPDVSPSFWAFQEIEALAASGITTGFPDGTFRPTAAVTRAQMATFLARALGLHWPN